MTDADHLRCLASFRAGKHTYGTHVRTEVHMVSMVAGGQIAGARVHLRDRRCAVEVHAHVCRC